jgi:hypothetical protein
MQPLTTKEKLYDFMRVADDKKIKAIYSLLENEIAESNEWWQDKSVVAELDKRYKNWQEDKEKGSAVEETKAHLLRLKMQKNSK